MKKLPQIFNDFKFGQFITFVKEKQDKNEKQEIFFEIYCCRNNFLFHLCME